MPSAQSLQAMRELASSSEPSVITFRVVTATNDLQAPTAATVGLDRGPLTRTSNIRIRPQDAWRYGVGAALMVHRDVLLETGGFKDELGAGRAIGGAEDLEFLWHASRHCSLSYRGDVAVQHASLPSRRALARKFRQYARALGALGGAVGGADGYAITMGYSRHIVLRTFQHRGRSVWGFALPLVGLVAAAEVIGTHAVVRLRTHRPPILCEACRSD